MRAALRAVLRSPLWFVAVAVPSYVIWSSIWSSLLPTATVPVERPAVHVDRVQQLYLEHDCAGAAAPGRPLLLITTPDGGPELVPAAVEQDPGEEQVDWLYDRRASFYGWCRA